MDPGFAGALGLFPYAERTAKALAEVFLHSLDDQACINAAPCFPLLVTIYQQILKWQKNNSTYAARVCGVCVCGAGSLLFS
jgi:hypothetical protein